MAISEAFQSKTVKSELNMKSILAMAKRRRYMTISVLAWATILLLIVTIVAPSVQSILEARATLATATDELAAKERTIQSLQSLDVREIGRQNQILAAALPIEKPVLPLLYSVDRLATNALVSVSNFQVTPGLLGTGSAKLVAQTGAASPISPQLATLPLKMSVAGGFDALSGFFQSLDNVVPFIQINSIDFSSTLADPDAKATASAQYSAEVSLSSLYLKSAIQPGTLTSIAPLTSNDLALIDRLTLANQQREADTVAVSPVTEASSSANLFSTQK